MPLAKYLAIASRGLAGMKRAINLEGSLTKKNLLRRSFSS